MGTDTYVSGSEESRVKEAAKKALAAIGHEKITDLQERSDFLYDVSDAIADYAESLITDAFSTEDESPEEE